jgi:hypothetical protein
MRQDIKRFVLFAGHNYYPNGGWDDFQGSFDTLEDAESFNQTISSDWWHIIDLTTGEDVG